MIKKIILKNFQSHKESIIDFCSGVNTIIGSSDVGKSSIMRAFYWLFYGKPLGDDYASNWIMDNDKLNGEYSVSIETDKGIVSRIKGKNKNVYTLNDKEFSSFGKGNVPEDIVDFLNISDINFQGQHDNSFLLSESSGEVSRILNRYVRMDIIDTSLSNINSKYRKIKNKKELKKEELEQTEKELTTYSYIEQMEKDITILKQYSNTVDTLSDVCCNISESINTIEEIKRNFIKYNKLIKSEKEHLLLLNTVGKINTITDDNISIHAAITEYSKTTENNNCYIKTISFSEDVDLLLSIKEDIYSISAVCQDVKNSIDQVDIYNKKMDKQRIISNVSLGKINRMYNQYTDTNDIIEALSNNINIYENTTIYNQKVKADITEMEKKYNSIFPNVCPLCGSNCKEGCK